MMVTSQLYNTTELTEVIGSGGIDNILKDLYIDKSQLEYQRKRYINALNCFTQLYGEGEVSVFSAPGRSEIGGNHTDHQNGKVLAASINLDIIAVVRPVNSKDSVLEEGGLSGHSGVNAGIIRIVFFHGAAFHGFLSVYGTHFHKVTNFPAIVFVGKNSCKSSRNPG